jgi:hypothetical protein
VLDSLPEVAAWGGFSINPSAIDGLPPFVTPFITSGADWFSTLEGGDVLAGRLPDPRREDEAVITAPANAYLPELRVGSHFTWRSLSAAQAAAYPYGAVPADFDFRTAAGPVTDLVIVGIVRMPMESVASFASDGLLLTSPGWRAQHPDAPVNFTNAMVRLRNGAADVPALRADIARITGRADIPVKDLSTDVKRVQRSLDVEHTALVLFTAAIALTALVLCGQAVVRATSAGATSVPTLRAMGATSGGLTVGLAAPMAITVVVAVAIAALVSVVASRWFPIGLAGRVDPSTGVHVVAGRELVGPAHHRRPRVGRGRHHRRARSTP